MSEKNHTRGIQDRGGFCESLGLPPTTNAIRQAVTEDPR